VPALNLTYVGKKALVLMANQSRSSEYLNWLSNHLIPLYSSEELAIRAYDIIATIATLSSTWLEECSRASLLGFATNFTPADQRDILQVIATIELFSQLSESNVPIVSHFRLDANSWRKPLF